MKIWIDTEFVENGSTIDLISLGAYREDGKKFYAEFADCDLSKASPWVREHVIPKLVGGTWTKPRSVIADEFVDFCGPNPEIWGYFADYDWVAICQMYGTMMDLPKGFPMFCMDVKQLAVTLGNPKLPEQGKGEHNALDDALWTYKAWMFLMVRWSSQYGATANLRL